MTPEVFNIWSPRNKPIIFTLFNNVCFSVGLEDPKDLIKDFEMALEKVSV